MSIMFCTDISQPLRFNQPRNYVVFRMELTEYKEIVRSFPRIPPAPYGLHFRIKTNGLLFR